MKRTLPSRSFVFLLMLILSLGLLMRRAGSEAAQSCSFTLGSTSGDFAAGGGEGSLAVSASVASCAWTAASNASWISIAAGAMGTGNGSVRYLVAANPSASSRTGTLTIAGETFNVNQAARIEGLMFYPLAYPVRLLDTRAGFSGCDAPGAQIPGASSRTQTVAGRACGGLQIPAFAQAITGNITTVQSGGGFLTLYPSDADRPLVANSNYDANQILNNVFTVGLGAADGAFKIYVTTNTDVVIDVTGYYAPPGAANPGGLYFHPLPRPVRLLETRANFTGCHAPGTPLPGLTETPQQATGDCAGLTIPAAARAIVGNATTVNPQGTGYQFFTLFPANAARPLAASSNYLAGQIMNGPFTVGLSPGGAFKIHPTTQTDLVIDVSGYYSAEPVDGNGPGQLFRPLARPVRLLETRPNFNGCYTPSAQLLTGSTRTQPARGVCAGLSIPADAAGIIGNATVVQPEQSGWLTFWPSDATKPTVAASNYTLGQIFNRHFIAGLGAIDGAFNIFTQATTHLVIDLSGYFAPPPPNQSPAVAAGANQMVTLSAAARLTGLATDDGLPTGTLNVIWSKVSGPGTVNFSAPNLVATEASFSAEGVYVLRLTGGDSLLTSTADVTITVSSGMLAVNAGADQVVTLPNNGLLVGSVTGGAGMVAVAWSKVSGPGPVIFSNASAAVTSATFQTNGIYVLRLTATDSLTTLTDDVQVTVNPDPTTPPPDPMMVAPGVDMTVATTVGAATAFLYTGANPIQTGVAPGTIKPERAAVLKGRVLDKSDNPLPLVRVTVLSHPEFGQTLSRADGRFDLAVNGGGVLTVNYEKTGFLPVQRTETVPWQDYCGVPDVVMMGYDANVTRIDLLSNAPVQVARSTISSDASGARRTTLLFKQGTSALMKLPGGAMAGLDKVHVRATEFTVGTSGPNAMPGELPANSAYTYAVEYSLDEAVAAGAIETTFSQPVVQYNENFLNFPVGIDIPSGAYDRVTGQWVASASGRVVKILSITSGTANLDVNGNGAPATDPEYAALDINLAERQQLATLYSVSQNLWRVPIIHFSAWDSNWPFGPPPDAEPPGGDPPQCDTCVDDDCEGAGCVIGFGNQTLGEKINITGAPFRLRYSSERQRGRSSSRSLRLPLSGASIPASLKRIELTVSVAGRVFEQSFPAQPNQAATFLWDGLDAYGRVLQARQLATVTIGYGYDGAYQTANRFGYNGNGVSITGSLTRREITLSRVHQAYVGNFDDRLLDLGGWTLDPHHFYDPIERVLYEGNGTRRSVQAIRAVIKTVAGNGVGGFSGDNVPAVSTPFFFPFSATVAPNGELYVADSQNRRIRKVDLNGIATTVAGTGANCTATLPCGDGGQAANAQLSFPTDAAFGPDGSLYIFDAQAFRIRKVAPGGVITTAVGNGQACADPAGGCGDGGPATQAQLSFSSISCCTANLTVAADGALYLGDAGNHRVRRVGPDGIITTIAGNGRTAAMGGCTVVGGSPVIATNACLSEPFDATATADGSVYFTDALLNQIFRVTADGFIRVVAGDGVCGNTGDGGPALAARMCRPEGITHGPDGTLYFSDWNNARIRRIDSNGLITAYAATGVLGFSGDDGPALNARIRQSIGLSFGVDGALYIGEANNHRIRKVLPPLPGFNDTDIAVPSRDGNELFKFNSEGRHLQTFNALTGAVKYAFGYDAAGRLITITDGDNNVTTIQRNASGAPTGVLSPYNQPTSLTLDANGYLATITNPTGEQHQFTYTSGGLMTVKRDPRNNQTSFSYDSLGRFIREDDAGGGSQTLTRTEAGLNFTVTRNTGLNRTLSVEALQLPAGDRQRNVTLPNGLQQTLLERQNGTTVLAPPDGAITDTTFGPDPRWRMLAPLVTSSLITMPGGLSYGMTFSRTASLTGADPLNVLSITDARTINGRTYASVYTAATRTFAFAMPTGRAASRTIDGQGRTTAEQTANLAPASYGYDARGRLATVTLGTGPEARASSQTYNASGFLASITDSLNRVTSFFYDGAGRVTQQTLADASVISFGYDAADNLTSITPPGRPAHTFTYNSMNLPATYTPPEVVGTGPTQYAYNIDRQLTTITQPGGATIAHAYDAAGRLSATTIAGGSYAYAYSATTGNLVGIAAPNGPALAFVFDGSLPLGQTWSGAVAGSVSQTFNNFFLPATQSVNGANTISFAYDNDNLLTGAGSLAIVRAAVNGLIIATALGNVTDARGDNAFGELTSYNASFGATPLYSFTATRDKLGRITQKTETLGGSTATYEYGYDLAGRLREVKLNGLTVGSYSYDGNGNRASRNGVAGTCDAQDRMTAYGAATYAYTPNGELLTKTAAAQTTTYGYDALGNLRTVTLPDGTQIEYLIDGLNRRIGKRVNGVLTQGWLYQDPLEPVAELDGANNLVSRFVYATRAQTPDYMIKGGVAYRLLTDHLGSVRLVVNTTSGAIAQRIDYDEFGAVLLDTAPGFQPFGFAGGLYDPQTKLVRFGARDYDSETGRWTAKDPAGFFGGGTNLYAYAGNDPINSIDREGRKAAPTDPVGLEIEMSGLQRELDQLNQEISQNADKCPTQEQLKKRMRLEREIAEIKEKLAALQKAGETKPPVKPPQEPPSPGPLDYLKAIWDLATGRSINTTISNATK